MGGAANDACEACLVSFDRINLLLHHTSANISSSKPASSVLHEHNHPPIHPSETKSNHSFFSFVLCFEL
jgi:hypothetical protein